MGNRQQVNKALAPASSGQPARAPSRHGMLDTSNPAATKPARGQVIAGCQNQQSSVRHQPSQQLRRPRPAARRALLASGSAEQEGRRQSRMCSYSSGDQQPTCSAMLHHILQGPNTPPLKEGHQPLAANNCSTAAPRWLCLDAASMEVEDTSAVAHLEVEPPLRRLSRPGNSKAVASGRGMLPKIQQTGSNLVKTGHPLHRSGQSSSVAAPRAIS